MCVRVCMCVCLKPTEANFFPCKCRGIVEENLLNDSGQLLFILILTASGAGAFSRDFTTNLARQCRAFSRALKIEKLKAPLFRGPKGAGATNDWCIKIYIIDIHSGY